MKSLIEYFRKETNKMATCFMRINKIKSANQFYGKEAHNLRKGFVPNADISRAHLNEVLVDTPEKCSFYEFYKSKLKDSEYYHDHKVRSNAIKGFEIVLTYGKEKDEIMPDDFDFEEWKKKNVEWLEETFGKENIGSVVLHMDEVNPHIHAVVVPMVQDKLNGSFYTKTRSKLHQLQNSYGNKMSSLGLKRGLPNSQAKHTDIKKFYAELNESLKYAMPEVQRGESATEYRERANEYLQKLNVKHFKEKKTWEKKIAERKTVDLQERLDFYKEKQSFENEKQSFERERDLFEEKYGGQPNEIKKDIQYLQGVKEAFDMYPDQEYKDAILAGLDEIMRYCEEKQKGKNKTPKQEELYEEDKTIDFSDLY